MRQSQFSRQIGELETYFGVELLKRSGKSLLVTEAGRQLAQVAREQFTGLTDFAAFCQNRPRRYVLGAGDSILHWVVLPRIGALMKSPTGAVFALKNLRSRDIATQLLESRLDFGILRQARVQTPLKFSPLGTVRYSLFIPPSLWSSRWKKDSRASLKELPWATLGTDGEFLEQLEESSARSKVLLNLRLLTDSFPQAARAALSGSFAAILPAHAEADPLLRSLHRIDPPWLGKLHRQVVLAWNPRQIKIRTHSDEPLNLLRQALVF
ncbi:MAG: LysR family transcriptional regulator [Blastochloris sp.]|nr:LysR family transcriptional regulator [Blastochloris sp.]